MIATEPLDHRIDEVLSSLPDAYVVAGQGSARLVVGPCGAFVLQPADTDLSAAAARLNRLTAITREAMCDHVTLVPFLDALAVTAGEAPRHAAITVAPLDLLADVLTHGPEVIDRPTLNALRDAVRAATLDGWRVGVGITGDKIDLCDPAQPTSTR